MTEKNHSEIKKQKKSTGLILVGSIALAAALVLLTVFVIVPAIRYNNAEKALNEGRFEDSITGFTELKEYRDAPERVKEATYAYADNRQQAGDTSAAGLFASIPGYRDSDSRSVQAEAERLFDQGEYAAACDLYQQLGTDYQSRADEYSALYSEAERLFDESLFDDSVAAFTALGMYADAKDRIPEVTYAKAETLRVSGDTAGAEVIFVSLGEYRDSANKAVQAKADGMFLENRYAEAYEVYITLDENYQTHADDYQQLYDNAVEKLETGLYDEAISGFMALGGYSDVELRISETKYRKAEALRVNGDTEAAEEIFLSLGNYQDSTNKAMQTKADGLYNAGDYDAAYDIYAALNENYQTNAQGYAGLYQKAEELAAAGSYDEAVAIFESLGAYGDAKDRIPEVTYDKAEALRAGGETVAAEEIFLKLGEYKDSADKAVQTKADGLYNAGDYAGAYDIYATLGEDYQTNTEGYEALYQKAEELAAAGSYDESAAIFGSLGAYCDAKDRIPEVIYDKAEALRASGDTEAAEEIFLGLGEYQDSANKAVQAKADGLFIDECYADAYEVYITLDENYQTHADDYQQLYSNAVEKLETGLYDEAISGFEALGNYSDVELRITETKYRKAEALRASGDTEAAEEIFLSLGEYQDSANKAVQAKADGMYNAGDYAGAYDIYAALGENYQTNAEGYKAKNQQAEELAAAGSYDEAVAIFGSLGAYGDAKDRIPEVTYDKAEALRVSGKTSEAEEIFLGLGEYKDSVNKVIQAKADTLFLEERYAEAYGVYILLDENYQTHSTDYQQLYDSAVQKLEAGLYDEAITGFEALGSYSDVELRITETEYRKAEALRADGDTEAAEEIFLSLGEYQDSADKAAQAKADGLYNAGDYAGANDIYAALGENYQTNAEGYKAKYQQAEELAAAGSYDEAVAVFESLGAYGDAKDKVPEVTYNKAEELAAAGSYDEAAAIFGSLGEYGDARDKVSEVTYNKAEALRASGDTEAAEEIFLGLGEYQDSADKAVQAKADGLYNAGDYAGANDIYAALGENYQTNAEGYKEKYQQAEELATAGSYDEAVAVFESLGAYGDAKDKVPEVTYNKAEELAAAGSYDEAAAIFGSLGEYGDARDKVSEVTYNKAETLRASGETEAAEEIFLGLGEYQDSADKAAQAKADGLYNAGDYAGAHDIYAALGENYQTNAEGYKEKYRQAEELAAAGSYDEAVAVFESLGAYGDAKDKVSEVTYNKAEELAAAGSYDEAAAIFGSLGEYSDARDKVSEVTYNKAETLRADGDTEAAEEIFLGLGEYQDSADKAAQAKADGLYNAGDYAGANDIYAALGENYQTNAEGYKAKYQQAEELAAAGSYDEAVAVFGSLGAYGDAKDKVSEVTYSKANALAAAGSYDEAVSIFTELGDYADAKEQISATTYAKAEALRKNGKRMEAVDILEGLNDWGEARNTIAEIGHEYLVEGDMDSAYAVCAKVGDLPESRADLQTAADYYIENAAYAKAIDAYNAIIDDGEAAEKREAIQQDIYAEADAAFSARRFDEAESLFAELTDYEDSEKRRKASARKGFLDEKYTVGSAAIFGSYEQDNDTDNGPEPLEWIVLRRDGDKALLMTRYAIDTITYKNSNVFSTWETSTARNWLNGVFMDSAFTGPEKNCLLDTGIHDRRIVLKGVTYPEGHPTNDKVFILSKNEHILYTGKYRKAEPTPYAVANGAWTAPNGCCYYWVRSQTIRDDHYGLYVSAVGNFNWYYARSQTRCIRPAVWVDLDAEGSGF